VKAKKPTKLRTLRVRTSDHEMEKLEAYAERHEVTVSHVIREYIRRLPNFKTGALTQQ
jgi:hypothetical protein